MLINHHSVKPVCMNLLGNDIDVVTDFKLFGVHINDKLDFISHITHLKMFVNKKHLFYLISIIF